METQQQQNEGEHYIYLHGILQLRLLHTYITVGRSTSDSKQTLYFRKKAINSPVVTPGDIVTVAGRPLIKMTS